MSLPLTLSLSFIVCHCLSLSFIVFHCLSLSFIVFHHLSLSFIEIKSDSLTLSQTDWQGHLLCCPGQLNIEGKWGRVFENKCFVLYGEGNNWGPTNQQRTRDDKTPQPLNGGWLWFAKNGTPKTQIGTPDILLKCFSFYASLKRKQRKTLGLVRL